MKKKYKILFSIIIMFSLLVGQIYVNPTWVYAYEEKAALIVCTEGEVVAARSGPGTEYEIQHNLANGKVITILDEAYDTNKMLWYKIRYNLIKDNSECVSYVRSDFVSITGDVTDNGTLPDDEMAQYSVMTLSEPYAQQLRNIGFPESYIPNLVALHTKYPNWTFTAQNTGLDWNTVLDKEMRNGVNLVQSSADDAKKSTNSGAYNLYTNKWTEYETGWVAVGRDYLAYCMDPRNFLNETSIYMFENISYNPNQSLAGVKSIVAGTFMEGTQDYSNESIDYASSIYGIAQTSGVSSYHIASKIKQEQGKGTSPLISGTYAGFEGYYNFFNFNAYGSTKDAIYRRGLTYAKKQGWSSRYLSILGGANKVKSDYIDRGQNTIYLEKFNVSSEAAIGTHQYMSNVSGAISEGQSVGKGYTDKNQAFNFAIPVYANMPEKACSFTISGNPNNYLSSLAISGLPLTPGFDATRESYSVVVDNSVSSITVSATPIVGTSTVSGTGTYNLNVGTNTIQVVCKSQSGSPRTYTITVSRLGQGVSGGSVVDGSAGIISSVYSVGTYITGVQPGTDATAFMSSLSSSYALKLLDASGNEKSGTVATGNIVAAYDGSGNQVAAVMVVIYGDVNGDGTVSVLDMIKMNRHIIGSGSLTNEYLEAADANRRGDGATVLDMIVMNNHITGKKVISQ